MKTIFTKYLTIPTLIVGLLSSCSENRITNTPNLPKVSATINQDYNNLKEALKVAKKEDALDSSIFFAYDSSKNYPYWFDTDGALNSDAIQLLDISNNALSYGLNPKNYTLYYDSSDSNLNQEIGLSQLYMQLSKDLHNGIFSYEEMKNISKLNLRSKDILDYASLFENSKMIDNLLSLEPQHHEYKTLKTALDQFVSKIEINDEIIKIGDFHKDSVAAYENAKMTLAKLNFINMTDTGKVIVDAVIQFQLQNGLEPDGLIGKNTRKLLERSTEELYLQAALNLNKWRWIEPWGGQYLFANIPEFELDIYESDSLVKTHKTVVGATWTKTPEIDSELSHFVVNPEWYVPRSITIGEILPKMKNNPNYMSSKGYSFVSGASTSSVDWENATSSNFHYKIKQKSGKSNALGKVKFIFNNKYSVFIHDTPSKKFFNKGIRTYSHGCVRLQNPMELASYFVAKEDSSALTKSFENAKNGKGKKTFTPELNYPIHIGYFSSVGTKNGYLKSLLDVYKRDDKGMKIMENRFEF